MSAGSSTTTRRSSESTRSSATRRPRSELLAVGCALLAACSSSTAAPDGASLDGALGDRSPGWEVGLDLGADGARADGGADRCLPSSALAAKVSASRLLADLTALVGLKERRSAAGQAAALAYLKAELGKLPGITLREQTYSYKGTSYANLEATIAGADATKPLVLAGAHYDSISLDDPASAPGADDNATGVSALLETARVLAGCRPQRELRLVFFSNEEVGTVGSKAYVSSLKATLPPARVIGFLNVDSVGYGPAGEDLDLATKPSQKAFADAVKGAVESFTTLKAKEVLSDLCG
jgi:Zn-dependent M28 family amino/carboxypeptidase